MRESRIGGASGDLTHSLLARGLRALVRVGILVLVARLFPLNDVGDFAFLYGAGTLVLGTLDLGLTAFLQREVGLYRHDVAGLEAAALRLRVLTLLPGVIGSAALAWLVMGDLHPSALGTLLFAAALVLADFLAGMRRARGDFRRESLEMVALLAGLVIGVLLYAVGDFGFHGFQASLGVCTLGVIAWRAKGILTPALPIPALGEGPEKTLFGIVAQARWFWALWVGGLILFELPPVLLRWLADPEEVALFAAAMRAVGLASQPFVVLGGVFVPSLAWHYGRSPAEYREVGSALNGLHIVSFPAFLGMSVLGGALLLRGFGGEYIEAEPSVWILAVGALVYLGAPSTGVPLIEGRVRALAGCIVAGALVMVAAAWILIPESGHVGAAVATTAGFLTAKAGHSLLYRHSRVPAITARQAAVILATLLWAMALWVSPEGWLFPVLAGGALVSAAATIRMAGRLHLQYRGAP